MSATITPTPAEHDPAVVHRDALGDPVGPKRWSYLAGFLVLCVAGGALIGVAFAGQTDAYETFNLPTWAPPGWLFGPVWTVLYTVMAIGAWMVAGSTIRSGGAPPSPSAYNWWSTSRGPRSSSV